MASIVEFPPSGVPSAKLWTKDTADTITGLGNVTYVKYKTTLSNKTYGNGLYVTWANNVANYTAGSSYGSSELPPSGLFDKLTYTSDATQPGWASTYTNFTNASDSDTPAIIYLQCPVAFVLKYYTIQARSSSFFYQTPSSWKIYGSLDGNQWALLDTQTSQTSWDNGTSLDYYITNTLPYTHYQIVIYRIQNSSPTVAAFAELKYFGIPYPTATQTGALEFPPTSIGAANTWTKDTGDTITGIGGTTYVKYKYTLTDTSYGTGQYIAWANTVANYSATTSYLASEKSPNGVFDKENLSDVNTNKGWATSEATYTNTSDANPAPQLYLTSPVPFILRYYTLQCRSDNSQTQMLSVWNIYGSLDGTSLSVLVDSQTSQTTWALGEVRTYNTTNQTAFTTYIIQCLRNNNATGTNISIGELKYYGTINMPIEGPVLEFPPPLAIGAGNTWTKDGTDTIAGIGSQVTVNLRKYKYVIPNTHPYGWGEYQAYANTVFTYSNSSGYGFNEWPPSGLFDKALAETNLKTGWHSADGIYSNTADATTPPEVYIKLPIKLFLTHYILRARSTIVTQMPIKWKLYGSNDGVTWILIDYVLNYTSWVNGINGHTTFFCYSDIPYQYYKLSILRINNATNTSLSIGDWYLFGMMYNVGLNTAQPSILEYPPPVGILTRSEWTKDLSDSVVGIGGSTYPKYKCTIGSSCPYGQGEYIAWANSIYDYNAGTTYSATECPPSSAFDKLAFNWTNKCGWQTKEFIWTNANDITTPAELYITLPQKVLLLSYSLAQRYDTNTRQYPTKWAVYGSNDTNNWTLIDTRLDTGATYFGIERFYTINTMIGSFRSYKISIVRSSFPNEHVHIGEWRLFGIPDVSTTNLEVLEYPPKQIGKGYTWVKDTIDTFISNNYETNPPTTYCKYKYQLNGAPYGNGEYVAWANTIFLGGGTAVSATYGANELPPSGAFDNSDSSEPKQAWVSGVGGLNSISDVLGQNTPELYIKLPSSIILNSYSISSYIYPLEKTVKKWEVYGSTDGSSWYKLDSRDNEENWVSNETRTYILDRAITIPYNYYKLRIYRNNSSSSTLVALSNWRLYGSPIDAVRMFEFPPPDAIGPYTAWEQDTNDQVTSVSGDVSTYYRWKNTVPSSHPYGSGEYACWANTNSSAWPVRGLFDPVNVSGLIGYATNLTTYTNRTDATNPPEIYLRLPVQIAPRKYHIMGRPDSGGISDMQCPSKWMLYGSNDENSWTLLDTRTNETSWSVAEVRNYNCNTTINTGSFRTFKLSLYRNNFSQEREYPPQIITSGMISNTDLGSQLYRQSATISGYAYGSGTYNFYARYVDALDWNAYGGWKCFDNNDTSFARGYTNHINQTTGLVTVGHYIQIDLPVSVILSRYGLYYTSSFYVSEWTIQGSNNGTSWTNIDTKTAITDWTTPYREFTLSSNSTAYNRYRFNPLKCLINGTTTVIVYSWRLFGFEQTTTNIIMGKWKMFGVPQTSTTTLTTPISYKTMMRDVHYVPDNIYNVMDISGLVGWYKGETWNASTNQWRDVSGSGNHATTTQGTISTAKWARNGMTYLYGGTTAGIQFPVAILPTTYTLFHVARYNGTVKKRIFDGLSGVNWLSGFWQGLSGVALHGGSTWMTSTTIDQFGSEWVVSTDQNNLYKGQGTNLTVGTPTTGVNDQLTINYGSTTADRGDWAVAEVLVYNRTLNSTEITTIETYLLNKWYNPISIFTQSPAAYLSMPTWYSYQSDIQAMPGLVGWYRGDTWRNNKWFDVSGNNNHSIATKGMVSVTSLIDRNGLLYLYGDTTTGILFPTSILPPNYTLFYVAKYTSSSYSPNSQRIFDGNTSNWYSGFKEGYSGHHAYHGVTIGSMNSDVCGTEWVLGTDQKRLFRSQGVTRGSVENLAPSSIYSTQLTINYGQFSIEASNWAVAEVIVFDRELNMAGIQFVENYLSLKYLIEREVTQSKTLTFAGTGAGKASWRYNIADITNMMTLYQGATRSGTTVSLVNANTAMSYGCALFPFDYKAPGNVYTIESEVLINSNDGIITKNALWLGVGANFVTSRYSWEYDQTNGYNLVTSVQSDFSAADSANTFDVVATNFTTYKQTPIITGLVVNLNFASISSNTVTNSANGSNNFTIGGSYSVVDSPFGKALRISGQNTYMTATTAITTATITCASWYNFQYSANDGAFITLFARNGGTYHHLIIRVDSNRYELGVYNTAFVGSGYYLTKGKWTHLACTMNGTTWKLYINGVFVFTTSSSFSNASWGFGIISNATTSTTQGAQGILADVRVYNTQLSDSDIMDIYTQTSPFNQSLISRVPLNADEVTIPPQALTADSSVISTASYGNGVYTALSSSNADGTNIAYKAFNLSPLTSDAYWHSAIPVYNTTTGAYTGAVSTTISGVAYLGEYLQLQTNTPFRMTKINITGRQDQSLYLYRSPNTFYIAGSNDGTTWYLITSFAGIADWTSATKTFTVNSPTLYTFHRCVVTVVGNVLHANRNAVNISVDFKGHFDNITDTKYTQQEVAIPPAAMTAASTNLSSALYATGTYIASSSSVYDGTRVAWKAFNLTSGPGTDTGNFFATTGAYNTTTGVYAGAISTTISGSAYTGEWLQIQLPYKLKLVRYVINPRQDGTFYLWQSPNTWKLAGSYDGTTWYIVDTQTSVVDWTTSSKTFDVNSNIPYLYYRLVVNANGSTANGVNRGNCSIDLLTFYGYTEDVGWKLVRHYVDLPKRRFRMTIPSQGVDVTAELPSTSLTNTGSTLGFAARTDPHVGNFQLRYCKVLSGWQEFGPLHLPFIDLDAMSLSKLQPGNQISLWRNSGLEGGTSDAVGYTDGTSKPVYLIDAMGQPFVRLNKLQKSFFKIPGTLRFNFISDDNTAINGISVVVVARVQSTSTWQRVIDFANGTDANTARNNIYVDFNLHNGTAVQNDIGIGFFGDGSKYYYRFYSNCQDTSWHVYTIRVTNNTTVPLISVWRDGIPQTIVTLTSDPTTKSLVKHTTTDNLIGKSHWTSDSYADYDLRELLIYRMPLADETIGTINNHLLDKWKLWKESKKCIVHFDASYLATVDGITSGGNVQTWKNLGDDNTIVDATGTGSGEAVYPPGALTANTTTLTSQAYGTGTYIASASTALAPTFAFNAFDNDINAAWLAVSINENNVYDRTSGAYTGTVTTTISGSSVAGEWLQIQFPSAIVLKRYELTSENTWWGRTPKSFTVAGSNDGTTWTTINTQTNSGFTAVSQTISFSTSGNTTYYKYYRIVVQSIIAGASQSSWGWMSIAEWNLYGPYYPTLSLSNGYYHVNFDSTYTEHFALNGTLDFNAFKNGDTATNGMTIVVVAQFSSTAGNMERIFDFGSGTSVNNIVFARSGTTSQVYYSIYNGGTQISSGMSPPGTPDVTKWHMYTITFTNGTSVPINLYIDGQLIPFTATATLSTALTNRSLTSCYIGRSNWGSDAYFTGNIRELIMYRTVLSSTELANLHTTLIKKWGLTDSSTAITLPLKVCHFDANDLTLSLSAGQKVSSWTNKANDVMVYPPAAMTANSTNLSSASWGKGTYVASASTEFSSSQFAFKAFDKIKYVIASGFINIWTSSAGGYNTSTGAQVRNTSTTMSSVAYLGDWLQIQMPQSIILTYYVLNIVLDRAPLTFYIGGSNNGTTWTLIDSRTGLSWGTTDTRGFYVNNTNAYTYYRIVINAVATPNNGSYASIGQWDLYGNHEGIYPITAMTANSTTISNQIYGNGTYVASTSSDYDAFAIAWKAFSRINGPSTPGPDLWHSSISYNINTGVYIGTISTIISGITYLGEWIQISFPSPIRILRYEINPRQDSSLFNRRSPNTWYLAGSNDGNTWTLIHSQSNISFGISIQNFSVNSYTYYSYYRLVTTIVGNSDQTSSRDSLQIDLWNIYGIVPFTNYSPTTFNATQATVNNQPILEQEDGLYHVDFTRANSHHLQISNALDFNCFQNNTSAQNGITAIVVGRMTNPGSFEKFFDFANSTSNNDIFTFVRSSTDNLSVLVRNGTTDITWNAVGSTLPSSLDGKWHIYTVVMTNATTPTYQTYYDGNLVGSYIATTSTMIINRTTVNNYLGRPNAPANGYLEGGIREMVIYKQALQSGDLANIHWDLMKKWRIYPSASLTKEIVLSHKPLHFDVNDLVYSFGLGEGSQVTTWRNLGTDGARVDAIGTGTTGKPTLYKENGMWYVRSLSSDSQYFSITNDIPFNHLQDGDGNYVGGYTITCVVRINSLLNNGRILHMATYNNENSLILCVNGTSDQLMSNNHNPTESLLSQFSTTSDQGLSNWHVVSYVFKNGSTTKAQFYVDGNVVNTSTQASLPLNNRIFKFVAIMGWSITRPIDGDIRELILHRNVLTTTELNSLHTQLMTKWGINTLSSAIERFPPSLTSNSSSVAGVPYTVVASTEFSTSTQGWTVFDGLSSDSTNSTWQSANSNYNTSTGDSIVTPALGTDDGYGGAWVYVTLPYGVIPKHYNLGGDMLTWRIYGNTSPSWEVGSWVALETRSKTALENYTDVDRYQLPNATNTSYYAFAVKVKKSSMYSALGRCSLHTFNIFGTQTLPYNVFSPNLMGYFTTGDDIGNWDVIYETTSAKRDANNNTVYSQRNDTNYTKPFTRVAYFMQNNMLNSNTTYWAFVSFTSWSSDITRYRLPDINDIFEIQSQILANMNIYSNHPQVIQRTGATGLANIWPYNIGIGGATYDYTNTSTGTGDYGAFQIYDMTTTDPIMCWNRHTSATVPNIGFGKNDATNIHYTTGTPTTHPNWVFSSTDAYNFKLKVMVR